MTPLLKLAVSGKEIAELLGSLADITDSGLRQTIRNKAAGFITTTCISPLLALKAAGRQTML